MQNEALFRDKPVWSAIFSMAIPSVFTILVMIVYNMAVLPFGNAKEPGNSLSKAPQI